MPGQSTDKVLDHWPDGNDDRPPMLTDDGILGRRQRGGEAGCRANDDVIIIIKEMVRLAGEFAESFRMHDRPEVTVGSIMHRSCDGIADPRPTASRDIACWYWRYASLDELEREGQLRKLIERQLCGPALSGIGTGREIHALKMLHAPTQGDAIVVGDTIDVRQHGFGSRERNGNQRESPKRIDIVSLLT